MPNPDQPSESLPPARLPVPSRRESAHQLRKEADHQYKNAARIDAELDLTDVWEEGRQMFQAARSLSKQISQLGEQISQWADDGERLCADRQAAAFLRLDSRPATTESPAGPP